MRLLTRFAVFAFCIVAPLMAAAQPTFYQHDTSVKVFAYSQQQTMAWCGGFNNPQFAMGDLNNDGRQDLVVFEPWTGVSTFINIGTPGAPGYRYAPEYAVHFPPIFGYLILADYNCDGVPDLFQRGNYGFAVYKGYYNFANQLCFTFYQDLFYTNDSYAGGAANAYCNPGDIPAIVDVDNDGDLDFISYNISGGTLNFYKNMRVEDGLPCDSIRISLKDRCWGKVYQGFFRGHQLGYSCNNAGLHRHAEGQRTTHSGNTPCLFDWDMDGDYDYLDGSVSYNEMTFLKNGRIETSNAVDTMVLQDTLWQTGGTQIELPTWPTAYNIDIDQDGKKDLLISPNLATGSENYKCIWYYRNLSTAGVPNWHFESDSFLTDQTIETGSGSYPMLFDYNKDGKPDLFVGSRGYYQSSTGLLRSRISYYQNTSTTGNPSFTLQTTDFMGINAYNFKGTAPAFGDIDNDGVSDMIIGHTDGTLSYFKNTAGYDTLTPNWVLSQIMLTDMNGDTINVDGSAAPFIYDIDKDGKKDLVIGDIYGYIRYYQNVSVTPGVLKLQLINKRLGKAKADPHSGFGNYAAPFIGKIDSTGVEYLLLGSNSGNIYRYTGFQTGDTTATYTMLDSQYAYIDTMYSSYEHSGKPFAIYGNLQSTVTVGDIAGDGTYGLITGNVKGGLEYYKMKVYDVVDTSHPPPFVHVKPTDEHGTIKVSPNPTSDELHISWEGLLQPVVQVNIINMAGQQLYSTSTANPPGYFTVHVNELAPGMYVCVVHSGVHRYYSKFTVVR